MDSLKAIGGDSTAVNTGHAGGVMQHVERKLGRKLVWIVCDLHTNELPLRKFITELDGKTLAGNKWSGDIGKLLDQATDIEIEPDFEKIDFGDTVKPLPSDVVQDLSTDQAYAYKIRPAIKNGVVSDMLANLQIGPVNHSRWLTTACRLCRLWVSKHGLKGRVLKNLRWIM